MELRPIGVVKSPVKEAVDKDWGDVISEIRLEPEYAGGLTGLEDFSHIQVVFFMHQATWNPAADLIRRPRGRADMPLVGIFAQRARHRPNPIGLTTVALVGVKNNVLAVRGLDAIDGTPVLDIKPYNPGFDTREEVKVPEWMSRLMAGYF
jgi:tRNA (adenine37-N6)-methyltransferase